MESSISLEERTTKTQLEDGGWVIFIAPSSPHSIILILPVGLLQLTSVFAGMIIDFR